MSEEVEVSSGSVSDDFWNTYQEFYLSDDVVEVGEVLVTLDDVSSCRHDNVADQVILNLDLYINSSLHEHFADKIHSSSIFADDCEHTHEPDIININKHLEPDNTVHYHYVNETGLATSSLLYPYSTVHNHIVDEATIALTATVDDTVHLLEDTGWGDITLTFTTPILADDCLHYTIADGGLHIGGEDDTVYPRDADHGLWSAEVGDFTFKDSITFVSPGRHLHTVEELPNLPMVYRLVPNDCTHELFSERVERTLVRADSSFHGLRSDEVWSWMDDSMHTQVSDELRIKVNIDALNCVHHFGLSAYPVLNPIMVVDDCYHNLFTKDTLAPADCSHELYSDELTGNTQYRRLYV